MDRKQFTSLVAGEQEALRRYLLALCVGNRHEADDIAQEALVKAYLSLESYHDTGRFTAWLYRIAHNTFLDYRRNGRSLCPLERGVAVTDSSFDADSAFRYQALYEALDSLPPKERSALLLYYIKGYNVREISKIVECSEEAVKKQMSRGRELLRKMLCE